MEQGVWLKCLNYFCFFLYYKTIQNRWKIYISVTFSCNFFGGKGLGGDDLNP